MAACATCGTTILFGGRSEGGLRFCNETCHANGALLSVAQEIPEDAVRKAVAELHEGSCPQCAGPGPVDVHTSHFVWSALILTSWSSRPRLSCRGCGRKQQLLSLLGSLVVGWWGFPWGFLVTPVQIVRNLAGMVGGPAAARPSDKMRLIVRNLLAQQALQQAGR